MPEPFAAALRRLRTAKGLGVRELARAVGIDHAALLRMEAGRIKPCYDVLLRLADVLDAGLDELTGRQKQ